MTTFHLSAFLASLATGVALPLRFETAASVFFTAGLIIIVAQDYIRTPRPLRVTAQPRVLRARAQFRALPLTVPTAPHGIEIRPIIHRLRENHRLAA